jgi:hypothetical protein
MLKISTIEKFVLELALSIAGALSNRNICLLSKDQSFKDP